MSGAEVLFGIGLLCNAMQIITFGRDALQVARHFKDDHSPDPRLRQYIDQSRATYATLSNAANSVSRTLSPEEKEIFDIGKLCNDRLGEMSKQLDKVSVPENKRGARRILASFTKGIRSIWSKSSLDDLEMDLNRHQTRLQQQLLLRICSQEEAVKAQRQAGFDKIDNVLQGFITQYAAGEKELSKLVSQGVEDTKNHVTMENNETRSLVRDGQSRQAADAALTRLLDSLAYPGMNDRKNMINENHPKTFRWAFEVPNKNFSSISDKRSDGQGKLPRDDSHDKKEKHAKFVSWLQSDLPLFWVSGKAGSGKSTFMKFLATHPQTVKNLQPWRPNVRILCHYFWIASSDLQKNQKGMLCSLLWQTLRDDRALAQRALGHLPDLNYKGAPSDWSMRDLVETLSYAWKVNGRPVCLFLDGLDEAADSPDLLEPTGHRPQSLLQQLLAACDMKICISSREEPSLVTFFEGVRGLRSLRIHELTEQDMKKFVAARFPVHPALPAEVRGSMLNQLYWKANGVFLWVVVAVESLKRGLGRGDSVVILQKRLDMMPPKLEELFRGMWGRLGPDTALYEKSASLLFNLHMAAYRMPVNFCTLITISIAADDALLDRFCAMGATAVSRNELRTKLSDARRIINAHCAGILEISSSDPTEPDAIPWWFGSQSFIDFAHRAAYDFMTSTDVGNGIIQVCGLSHDDSRKRIILAVLVQACFPELSSGRPLINPTPFGDRGDDKGSKITLLRWFFVINFEMESIAARQEIANVALKWQLAGHFALHDYWRHPTLAQERSPGDFRLFQYLEAAIMEGQFGFVEEQLDHLHTEQFLDAVPIICRAVAEVRGRSRNTTPWEYCCKRLSSPGLLQDPRLLSIHSLTLVFIVLDMLGHCLEGQPRGLGDGKAEDLPSRLSAAPRFMTSFCPTGEVLNMTIWLDMFWTNVFIFNSPRHHIPGRKHASQLALACNPAFMTRLLTKLIGTDDREWDSVADSGVVEAPLEVLMLSSDKGKGFRRPRQVDKARLERLVQQLLFGKKRPISGDLKAIYAEAWENGTMIGVGDWESGIGYVYDRGYFIHPWSEDWYGLRVPESGTGRWEVPE